ncbi:hypothetical protein Y1Q_0013942 [Alligator mississippiensis]|uniref:Uncharacterized protein n=1 Tax=Alligator mississippiensis TaxID=8496 RepID=A0A151P551_ALLMI|nr:hypothetical protein Y1Q_0013942 [Alligator mississippiensis]
MFFHRFLVRITLTRKTFLGLLAPNPADLLYGAGGGMWIPSDSKASPSLKILMQKIYWEVGKGILMDNQT